MSGEIMYNKDKVNSNALQYLNQVLENLKEAISSLEGIDTSDLEIDLEIDKIIANINENIGTIRQIKSNIMNILDEYIQLEIINRQLVYEVFDYSSDDEEKLSDEKTTLFDKLLDIREKFSTTAQTLAKQSIGTIISQSKNIQPKNNSDIAHRGYTPGGIYDNSAESFRLAGEKGFWGCETDIRFNNGNLVCSHNAVKHNQNPTSFEEYLDICKEYGMTAIIDLKYENGSGHPDENLAPAVLKTIQEKGMLDSCVLQTNNHHDIPYIRELSEDARIWYLIDYVSDPAVMKLMTENGVECANIFSSAKNEIRIRTLNENGIDACVWGVETESSKERILNMGAKYVMSDYVLGITPYQEGDIDVNGIISDS